MIASGVQPLNIIFGLFNQLEAAYHVPTQVDSGTADSIDACLITDDIADQINLFDELTGDLDKIGGKHDESDEIYSKFNSDVDKECINPHRDPMNTQSNRSDINPSCFSREKKCNATRSPPKAWTDCASHRYTPTQACS